MKVLERFSYIDTERRSLEAAPGFKTDGASIPRILWTPIGSPFTGKYVKAAVIHDVGCVTHKYTWQETHRMFYEAMIDSGVDDKYAKLLYFGVRFGGPRWSLKTAEARTLDDLKDEIRDGIIVGNIEKKTTPALGGGVTYFAHFYVPLSSHTLTEQEIQEFQDELDGRSLSGTAMTLTEIDARTEN